MKLFVYFSILIIFVLWLQYELHKDSRLSKKSSEAFWKNESRANLTRRADLSSLEYITIPYDRLPMTDSPDSTINSYRDIILSLSGKKIVNLTGLTNTDLKLKYGAANLDALMEYDNNYTILVSMLHKWGDRLYNQGYTEDAVKVLEFAVICLTDVGRTYQLLAEIYRQQDAPEKIEALLGILPFTKNLRKDKLTDDLKKKINP